MDRIKDRKGLFTLLSSVCESNREYFTRFGKWRNPQIKVFWLEVNKQFLKIVIENSGIRLIDNNLYEIEYEDDIFWIDTNDERIWQIITFAETKTANKLINNIFTTQRGVDRIWLTEIFMKSIQKKLGYENRGFGIKFRDILTKEKEDMADFAAKFWIGKDCTDKQNTFLQYANDIFSLSTIRFGRKESLDTSSLSGELYELYFNGHMTVTTCDDIDKFFEVISYIRTTYKTEIEYLEKECKNKISFVEIQFLDKVNLEGFNVITDIGIRDLRLWLQPYEKENDFIRYSGVDLHTGDFVYIDLSNEYSYISASKDACMNVAPRLGTLSSRYMCTNTRITHNGVELFA